MAVEEEIDFDVQPNKHLIHSIREE